jgi:hypothetical protein
MAAPVPQTAVTPEMIAGWRDRLVALQDRLDRDPRGEWAWLWRVRVQIISHLLRQYGGGAAIPESPAAAAASPSLIEGIAAYTLAPPSPFRALPEFGDTGPRKPFSAALKRIAAENRERHAAFEREREAVQARRRKLADLRRINAVLIEMQLEDRERTTLLLNIEGERKRHEDRLKIQALEDERARIAAELGVDRFLPDRPASETVPAEWLRDGTFSYEQMLAAASATITDEEAADILLGKLPTEPPPLPDFVEDEEPHSAKPDQEPT